ncbi:hypothetical protein SAMN04488136_1382 [Vibrio xiamenensis]|uniref:Uncharacterized protein n=1 Tax=Vibrio xiamenensis TaxID=861298 RepID=A0A1G8GIR6_9VIBR|nr:hypothetical protein [Vibrio xiamenensis]SDH94284.1 hypothetical protein SAMN04488136_1382 [Vibrio xiamenensis]
MKKPSTNSKSKTAKVKESSTDEKSNNIHDVRKKIENILLEREQKKLWDL